MKIQMDGSKICVSPRPRDGGIVLTQGVSQLRMTPREALAVIEAMKKLMPRGVLDEGTVDEAFPDAIQGTGQE